MRRTLEIVTRGIKAVVIYAFMLAASFVLIPIFILLTLYHKLFGVETDPTPERIAEKLRDILADIDEQEAWEDLDSTPIKEPRLEAIRKEALSVLPVPIDAAGRAQLIGLLARAEALGKEAADSSQ